jgi:hypothetical protein
MKNGWSILSEIRRKLIRAGDKEAVKIYDEYMDH